MDRPATRARLSDVARRAGVSNSTVSLVMNASGPVAPATRERVLAAAADLGYDGPDPRARSLRRGSSGIVAVVLDEALDVCLRDPINRDLLDGIAEAIGEAGLSLLLVPDAIDDPRRVASAPLDAAVLLGCSTELDSTLDVLLRRQVPVVAIEAPHVDGVVAVDLDNREASAALAAHLHDLGHRDVAMLVLPLGPGRDAGPLTPEREAAATVHTSIERMRGVRSVYPDAGGIVAATSSVAAGREAGAALLTAQPRPTAIIAQSDLLALGVLRAAEDAGLEVPQQLSVVGFDGIRSDETRRTLTTMVQPGREKGVAAGAALLAALGGGRPASRRFTSELRVGDTSGPAPR